MKVGRYRKVETRIWNDERFRKLSDSGKFLFLFILTHPNLTSLGAMRATIPGLSAELGWQEARCDEAFAELVLESHGRSLVEIDKHASFVGLPNFLKYNAPENPNVVKSWSSSLELLPECPLKTKLMEHAHACLKDREAGFLAAWETVCETVSEPFRKPVGNGLPNQEPEPEQEPEPKHKPRYPASGVCNQGQGKSRKSTESVFKDLTVADLKDNRKLFDWLKNQATQGKRPLVKFTEATALNVFAAAERALECGENPVALFSHIVGKGAKGDWTLISSEQEERARKRLNELKRAVATPSVAVPKVPNNDQQRAGSIEPTALADVVGQIVKKIERKPPENTQQAAPVTAGAAS